MSSEFSGTNTPSTQHSALSTHPLRLGLLGGTFNPIHRCHLAIAAHARDRLSLDRILFIPTGDPPHKSAQSLAPSKHRYEMVRLAVGEDPTFAVSDIEVRRTTKSYSIDTVRALQRESAPDTSIFFILGLDAFLELPTWKEAVTLLKTCYFVVVSRPGVSFTRLADLPLVPSVPQPALATLDEQQQGRLDLAIPDGKGLVLLRLPPCEVSASDIRARCRKGLGLANLLPTPV
ncbi:MAG: nicotinate-nucleotide adenylyltransferase, partial [Nitrospiraceae bacterium]